MANIFLTGMTRRGPHPEHRPGRLGVGPQLLMIMMARQATGTALERVVPGRCGASGDGPSPAGNPLISLRADAPIDRKRMPGNVPGLVGKQPDDRISDLFGLTNAPHRDK
jgi:hypothetical protein